MRWDEGAWSADGTDYFLFLPLFTRTTIAIVVDFSSFLFFSLLFFFFFFFLCRLTHNLPGVRDLGNSSDGESCT